MLCNFLLVLLFIDKICPSWTKFWIYNTAILELQTKIGIECQMLRIEPPVRIVSLSPTLKPTISPFIFIERVPAVK